MILYTVISNFSGISHRVSCLVPRKCKPLLAADANPSKGVARRGSLAQMMAKRVGVDCKVDRTGHMTTTIIARTLCLMPRLTWAPSDIHQANDMKRAQERSSALRDH